jgi:hypothetical protein
MRTQRILLVLVLLLFLATKVGSVEGSLPLGVSFVSPNGQYSVQLEEINGAPHFVITERGTSREDNSIRMPTLLLYLHWAGDSKSFVTVEHIAKGSRGRVVYLEADKWKYVEVDPPFEGKTYHKVINLQLGSDSVHYKFVVTPLTSSWMPIEDRFCDFDVSLKTGKTSNVKWSHVSDVASLANLMQNPVYLPAMDYKGPFER